MADNPWPPENAPTIATSLVCEDGERPSRAFPGVSSALSFILCCVLGWFPHVLPALSSCGPSARLIKAHPVPGAADKQGTHCRAPTPPAGPVSTCQTGLKFLPAYPHCVSSSYFAKNDMRQEMKGWDCGDVGYGEAWDPAARSQRRPPGPPLAHRGHVSRASPHHVENVLFAPFSKLFYLALASALSFDTFGNFFTTKQRCLFVPFEGTCTVHMLVLLRGTSTPACHGSWSPADPLASRRTHI